jgi:hypothetical protein
MKKLLIASLFVLTAISSFGVNATDLVTKENDKTSIDINVKAVVAERSALIVTDDIEETKTGVTGVEIDYGVLDKNNLTTTEGAENTTVKRKTLYVRRVGSEEILIGKNSKVDVSVANGNTLTLVNNDPVAATKNITGTLTIENSKKGTSTRWDFDVVAKLNHDSVKAAGTGMEYKGTKQINIVVTDDVVTTTTN